MLLLMSNTVMLFVRSLDLLRHSTAVKVSSVITYSGSSVLRDVIGRNLKHSEQAPFYLQQIIAQTTQRIQYGGGIFIK
jgi:hypothetical protein